MTYTDLMLAPIYTAFGVTISFALSNDDVVEIRGLDKSGGVEVSTSVVDVPSVRPACIIRMYDLLSLELAPDDLVDAVLELNGVSWVVTSYFPKPSPFGESDGELYILLSEAPA